MARHWFGQGSADWTFTAGAGDVATLAGGITVTLWTAPVGGVAVTDLLDGSGSPVTSVTSSDGTSLPKGTLPRFQGPDGTAYLWADAGGGSRVLLVATDIGDVLPTVNANTAAITALQATVGGLSAVASSGAYSDLTGKPTLAPVASSGAYADLTGTPAPGLQVVTKVGGSWPPRATTAPDTTRPAMWIGPAPAPAAGSGFGVEGDVWMVTPV